MKLVPCLCVWTLAAIIVVGAPRELLAQSCQTAFALPPPPIADGFSSPVDPVDLPYQLSGSAFAELTAPGVRHIGEDVAAAMQRAQIIVGDAPEKLDVKQRLAIGGHHPMGYPLKTFTIAAAPGDGDSKRTYFITNCCGGGTALRDGGASDKDCVEAFPGHETTGAHDHVARIGRGQAEAAANSVALIERGDRVERLDIDTRGDHRGAE